VTARRKLTPDTPGTIEGVVRYMRSNSDEPKVCICCPDEPQHVFCYAFDEDAASASPPLSSYESRRDVSSWLSDMFWRTPDGGRLRITVELLPTDSEDSAEDPS